MGGHRRTRATGRLVIAAVLGTVLTGTVLVGVGVAAPTDAPPVPVGPGVPAAPALPGAPGAPGAPDPAAGGAPAAPAAPAAPEPRLPALPAVPALPTLDDAGDALPSLPGLPALPANPLDPVNGLPQTGDVQERLGSVGGGDEEEAAAPEPQQSDVLDGARRIEGTPCSGDVSACVDLTTLQSWLIVDGSVKRGPVPVRVGDEMGPTPVGRFQVEWKDDDHVSSELGTPMPFSVFFADGGIGFHEGRQDTDSAGCVKLTHEDAMAYYYTLQIGDGVQVVRTAGS